jgi:hypothetical protein
MLFQDRRNREGGGSDARSPRRLHDKRTIEKLMPNRKIAIVLDSTTSLSIARCIPDRQLCADSSQPVPMRILTKAPGRSIMPMKKFPRTVLGGC